MDLYQLSRAILSLSPGPITKIRFARLIYFTHKELIRKGLMQITDIAYIRSPLGPVPEGLQKLAHTYDDIALQKSDSTLSYAAEEFVMKNSIDEETNFLEQYRDVLKIIDRTLQELKQHRTLELIEASHDPSWHANFNGTRYYLTTADLKNTFPFAKIRLRIRIKPEPQAGTTASKSDLGRIQANLLRGMLNDIVKESTDLEYPDEPLSPDSSLPSRDNPPLKFSILPLKASFGLLKNLSKKPPKKPAKSPQSSPPEPKPSPSPQSDSISDSQSKPEQTP